MQKWLWLPIGLIVIIFSWPYREPDISGGIDGSYFAFFNYFFHHQIGVLQHIQYPFGPLGFLYSSLAIGNNLIISYFFWSSLKLTVFYTLYQHKKKLLKTVIITSILFYAVTHDYLFYTIVSFSLLQHFIGSKNRHLTLAILITVIGSLIKVNIGFICALMIGSYSLVLLHKKAYHTFTLILLTTAVFFTTLWLALFQNLSGSFSFLQSQVQYILNNNDAMALYPPNNWWLISLMIFCFLSPLMVQKDRQTKLLYFIHLLVFFALFKYAFGRQENGHSIALFHFLIYFLLLSTAWLKSIRWGTVLLLIGATTFYSANLKYNQTFHKSYFPTYGGPFAFSESVLNHNKFKQKYESISAKNLEENSLPQSMLNKIGNQSIDFFPWDLTYFIPNQLNYTPRQMLQTGGYPSAIVKKNAIDLATKGPNFILWEKKKWNGEVGSVDKQYLFNVDGDFLFEIINNYSVVEENKQLALLMRSDTKRLSVDKNQMTLASFGKWIPIDTTQITRVKIKAQASFKRKIQQTFYKVPRAQIEYLLADSSIVKYEITESSMKNGLWINPYIYSVNTDAKGKTCLSFRLTQADWGGKYSENFNVFWEFISINNPPLYSEETHY